MAKSTRSKPDSGNVAVMEPPEPDQFDEQPPEPLTTVTETADAAELERRRGRGATKAPSIGFFHRLTQYDAAQWENELLIYMYRLAPITDRLATGNQCKFISKLNEPIDEDYILKNRLWGGSGKYRLTLNRREPGKKGDRIVDQVEIDIENPQYPPVVPEGEWVNDPRNDRWAWARKPKDAPPVAGPNPMATVQEALTIAKTMQEITAPPKDQMLSSKDLVELITKTQIANDPAKLIATASTLLEMAKPAAVEAKPDPAIALLTAELQAARTEAAAAREREFKLMERLLDRQNTPPPDPETQLTKTLDLLSKVKEHAGVNDDNGRSSRMTGWQEMLAPALEQLAPYAGTFINRLLTLPPPGTVPTTAVRTTGTPTAGQPQETPMQPNPAMQAIITEIAPEMLNCLNNGDGGEVFGDWIIARYGSMGIQIARSIGKEGILQIVRGNPNLWAQIQPIEARFATFVDEFLAWTPAAEEEEPPPLEPPKSRRKEASR